MNDINERKIKAMIKKYDNWIPYIILVIGFLTTGIILTFGINNVNADGVGNYPAPTSGDWIIKNETHVWNETINLNGHLKINDGGNLTFRNITLIMNCNKDGDFKIKVKDGGKFSILDYDNNPLTTNDRSNITANNNLYEFKFLVDEGAEFIMKNSELSECGYHWYGEDGIVGLTIKANNTIIESSYFYNNYRGISFYSSNNNSIINNTIYSNKIKGIYLSNSRYNQILNNSIFSNNDYGIYLSFSSNSNQIVKNKVINNQYGIYLLYANNNTIINNNISKNDHGIRLYSSSNTTIINNNYNSNYNSSISIHSSTNNLILNSTIYDSGISDFYLNSNTSISAINTTFNKNKVYFDDAGSKLTINLYLSVQVLYKNQNPISNGKIRIQDNENSTYDESYLTNPEGWVKWINLTEYVQNRTGKTFYSPYIIQAETDCFWNETTINLNESKEIVIILEDFKNTKGNLSGFIKDQYNNSIEGVEINLEYHNAFQETSTNENGYYSISNIPICFSLIKVTASKEGYYDFEKKISVDENTILNITFEPIPLPKPDFIITSNHISFSSPPPIEGQKISIYAEIKNIGNINAKATVTFYLDIISPENQIGSKQSILVPVGKSDNVYIDWICIVGEHKIYAEITDSYPEESDTTNNQAIKTAFVESKDKEEKSYIPSSETIAVGSTIGICSIVAFVLIGTEIGLYKFLILFILPLYFKITRKDLEKRLGDDKFTIGRIFGYIELYPGAKYSEIKKSMGLNNGTTAYHLNKLEKTEFIKSKRIGKYKHFYPAKMKLPEKEVTLSQIQQTILRNIEDEPGISQLELASNLGVSRQLVDYHLRILSSIKPPFIKLEKSGRKIKSYIYLEKDEIINVNWK